MDLIETWQKNRAGLLVLIFAIFMAVVPLGDGVVGPNAMPYGDGVAYGTRAFTLYGYLHTGQWSRFWEVVTQPRENTLAPLHYWIFFLLPQALASVTAYGVILSVSSYLLLALAVWGLCTVLERPAWAPILFLLCAAQNITLDETLFYFLDTSFFAWGILVFALQLRAWKNNNFASSALSGGSVALLFLIKPANALVYLATYLLAEAFWAAISLRRKSAEPNPWPWRQGRHLAGIATGFFPLVCLVMSCGALQTIFHLIDANEDSNLFTTHLNCTGLFRLFYFPLCLSFYYNVTLLALAVVVVGVVTFCVPRWRMVSSPAPTLVRFPWEMLVPLAVAYFLLGEYFSFGMNAKSMRSLLLVLPPLWLLILWLMERCRVRPATLFLMTLGYVACAYGHVFFNAFPSKIVMPESFQLEGDWLHRFPQAIGNHQKMAALTRTILQEVHANYPQGGKIAVGSDLFYFTSESLSWMENSSRLLQGESPIYHFQNFLRADGYCRLPALVDAGGMVLYLNPALQYSPHVLGPTHALLFYSHEQWENQDHIARLVPLISVAGNDSALLGYLVVFKAPLDRQQVLDAMATTQLRTQSPQDDESERLRDRTLSWSDCRDILLRWKHKHAGL